MAGYWRYVPAFPGNQDAGLPPTDAHWGYMDTNGNGLADIPATGQFANPNVTPDLIPIGNTPNGQHFTTSSGQTVVGTYGANGSFTVSPIDSAQAQAAIQGDQARQQQEVQSKTQPSPSVLGQLSEFMQGPGAVMSLPLAVSGIQSLMGAGTSLGASTSDVLAAGNYGSGAAGVAGGTGAIPGIGNAPQWWLDGVADGSIPADAATKAAVTQQISGIGAGGLAAAAGSALSNGMTGGGSTMADLGGGMDSTSAPNIRPTGGGSMWDSFTKALGIGANAAGTVAGAYSPNISGILGGLIGAYGSNDAAKTYADAIKAAAAAADPFASQRPGYQKQFQDAINAYPGQLHEAADRADPFAAFRAGNQNLYNSYTTGGKNIQDSPWMQSLNNTITDNTAQRLSSKYGGDVSSLGVRNAITGQVAAANTPVAMSYLNTLLQGSTNTAPNAQTAGTILGQGAGNLLTATGNAAGANIAPYSGQILATGAQNNYNQTQQTYGNLGAAANSVITGKQQSPLEQLYNLANGQPTGNNNIFQQLAI